MEVSLSRREAIRRMAMTAGVLLAGRAVAATASASPPQGAAAHLSEQDPMATMVSYHQNAKTVNPKEYSEYRAGAKCANCKQVRGQDGQAWRPCALIPGRLVSAEGWCQVYEKKA